MARMKKDKSLDQRIDDIERECFDLPAIYLDKITDCEMRVEEVNERIIPVIHRIDDLEAITKRDLVIINDLKDSIKQVSNDIKGCILRLEHLEKKNEYTLCYTNETREHIKQIDSSVTARIASFVFIAAALSWCINIIIRFYL